MFSKKKKIKNKIYIILAIIFISFSKFSTNILYADTYKIKNVEVIKSYDLNFNKLNVIESAFTKAYSELIQKITSSEYIGNLNKAKINDIKNLVDSFSIIDEKFIDNNYHATFEVDFDKKNVLKYLEKKNIFTSIPIEKEIFILPIMIDTEKNQVLLLSENYFYNNWNNNNKKYYLLKYILPNEDIDDIKFIQSRLNNIEEYEFDEIVSKYNLNDYIIAIFFKDKKNIKILSKINFNKNLSISNEAFSNFEIESKFQGEQIIEKLKISYENEWKKINQINTSIKLSLTMLIESKNLNLIDQFEKKLFQSDLVYKYNIDAISNDNTIYKIMYNSTPDKFLSEFKNNGFEIDTSGKIWKIK